MEDNGTYRYPPQGNPKPPVRKPDIAKLSRTFVIVALVIVLAAAAGSCFYTVNDKQQAVVTTFGKVTDVVDAGVLSISASLDVCDGVYLLRAPR